MRARLAIAVLLLLAACALPANAERARALRIAIDIGHSTAHPGATSARGVAEVAFNWRLALELEAYLAAQGFTAVRVINRAGDLDGAEGLWRRAATANAWPAELFLSIHHDSVQAGLLEPWTFKDRALRRYDGAAGFSVIYSEMNPQAAGGRAFAEALGAALIAEGLPPSPYHARDIDGERRRLVSPDLGVYDIEFLVVRETAMPAVLLEAGFIVNSAEEARLDDPAYRARIIRAVGAALERWAAER